MSPALDADAETMIEKDRAQFLFNGTKEVRLNSQWRTYSYTAKF
jgi:hypothetical protein